MIPVSRPLLEGNERKYVMECLETGWISGDGPFVTRFEEAVAQRVDRKHAIAVCNGSVALDLAVVALGIGPGDEVIMPSLTIISCAAAVMRAGAVPRFVDVDPETWNMSIDQIAHVITPRTKAILAAHTYGLPIDMDPLLNLASQHGLAVIEDAAEMHGQTYKGRPCGSFGDISTFSFYANKHVTTGEGGMVVVNDSSLAQRCRSLRNLCFVPERRFIHYELGWNFRLSNLLAAVGLAQIERLDHTIKLKRQMGHSYLNLLKDLTDLQQPVPATEFAENVFWVYGVVPKASCALNGNELAERLHQYGVATRPFFYPLHRQPVVEQKFGVQPPLPVTERLSEAGFYLPSGTGITFEEIQSVSDSLHKIMASHAERLGCA